MLNNWRLALDAYSYPVNFRDYERAHEFPEFFDKIIVGDRNSTIEFEDYYRGTAPNSTAAFFEVVYWKLYSQARWRDKRTNEIVDFIQEHGITQNQLWKAVQQFINSPSKNNLKKIRDIFGLSSPVLAVPLTLVSLAIHKNSR